MSLTDVPVGHIATIVTHLEMTEKPILPEILLPDTRLVQWDQPEPTEYKELFRAVGEDWLWVSRLILPDDDLLTIIRDLEVCVYHVEQNGKVIGMLELDFRKDAECEIGFFGLVPEMTGKGLGRWLMQSALRLAWRDDVCRVWLHTCTLDSPYAVPFYEKSGFNAFSRQVEIFRDPRLTGQVPRSAAPHVPVIA